MESSGHFFQYQQARLHYSKTGDGQQVVLLFHGFGQDKNIFNQLADTHFRHYTLYAFDLFFHGKSTWGYDEQPLEKSFWLSCVHEFLAENRIEKFSVVGFSLGSRFALSLAEGFPKRVEHLYLLAPDSIKTSFWYRLATYPILFRKLFKSMVVHPNRFFVLTNALQKLNIMDKGLIRFAESQMNTEEKRNRVYYSWVVFRHLSFKLNRITTLLNQEKLPTTLVLGEHDKMITHKNLAGFINRVPHLNLVLLKCGHNDLIRSYAAH